jgi:hypothetical protein
VKITIQIDDGERADIEIDDELLEFALDKPDFISGEVREYLYTVLDE